MALYLTGVTLSPLTALSSSRSKSERSSLPPRLWGCLGESSSLTSPSPLSLFSPSLFSPSLFSPSLPPSSLPPSLFPYSSLCNCNAIATLLMIFTVRGAHSHHVAGRDDLMENYECWIVGKIGTLHFLPHTGT